MEEIKRLVGELDSKIDRLKEEIKRMGSREKRVEGYFDREENRYVLDKTDYVSPIKELVKLNPRRGVGLMEEVKKMGEEEVLKELMYQVVRVPGEDIERVEDFIRYLNRVLWDYGLRIRYSKKKDGEEYLLRQKEDIYV